MRMTVFMLFLALTVGATKVDFWNEYPPVEGDEHLYLQAQFNGKQAPLGPVAGVRAAGDATIVRAGRFGGALRVQGAGAAVIEMAETYPGGFIAVEAWVKLERLPEDEGCVVFRQAVVDGSARYNPEVDRSKGWKLLVDHAGALHLETTNTFYGNTVRTSSRPGVVPVGEWVHLAGISVGFPHSFRRVYCNGETVGDELIAWGQGLTVGKDRDLDVQPIYIGNNREGIAGIVGLIDQVRIHRNIYGFWPNTLDEYNVPTKRPIPDGPPSFVADHRPLTYLPLDGNAQAQARVEGLEVKVGEGGYVDGVRGQGLRATFSLSAPDLLNLHEGSIEFWVRPVDVNNYSDRNVGMLNFHPANFYIFNGGSGPRPLSLNWSAPGGHHFVSTSPAPDFQPGRWYHFVLTWRDKDVAVYLDGKESGRTLTRSLAEDGGRDTTNTLSFNTYAPHYDIDEVRVYDERLTKAEIANAYRRYLAPETMIEGVREDAVDIVGEYLASARLLTYRLRANRPAERVRLTVRGTDDVVTTREAVYDEETHELPLPELPDGDYVLAVDAIDAIDADGTVDEGARFSFVRKHFAWEDNELGKTGRIFPPFQPVEARGPDVRIVGRRYRLNGFGLCDEIETLGRNILAAPMTMQGLTAGWELGWEFTGGWQERQPKRAVWQVTAANKVLRITASTTVEIDGCARVAMRLEPGPEPTEIEQLYVDIPLRAAEARLYHSIANGLRRNPAGFLPEGDGVVFDGSTLSRSDRWRNNFVPYLWLGTAVRGLAVFAENDRGWITEKGKSDVPTHEVIREGDRVTIRLYLVNRPATITEPRELVWGFQASPTKPLPPDWRAKLAGQQGGLAVVPWGGLQCSSQGPYNDDWTIVDKIVATREGKGFDNDWLAAYVAEHNPPPVHGTWDWASSVRHFAGRMKGQTDKPIGCYHEEMIACKMRPEWVVFQDEWKLGDGPLDRRHVPLAELPAGQTELGGGHRTSYPQSYRDFATWMANEWLQRGLTLYWDNTYLRLATNTRNTAAYVGEDGHIQPALIIWNQRAYQKRVWHLLQERREDCPYPLEWTIHMTNTLVLPVHGWATADLDHELGRETPFPPDWLRTETTGLQVGNYALSHYAVTGKGNKTIAELGEDYLAHTEWAMRITHNIQHNSVIPVARTVREFGWEDPDVPLHNYWADEPAATIDHEDVKWMILARPADREAVVVLASWATEPVAANVIFDPAVLGFDPAGLRVVDAVSGEEVAARLGDRLSAAIPGPWGMRAFHLSP